MSLEIDDGARAVVDAATPALEALGISKQFGTVRALENVSLKLARGSVHALLGENGAGKSTLVKCIMGYYSADVGQVLVNGVAAHIKSPRDAAALGIGMVYQHFTLVDNMTVAENLVLARPSIRSSSTGPPRPRRSPTSWRGCRSSWTRSARCACWRPARSRSWRS